MAGLYTRMVDPGFAADQVKVVFDSSDVSVYSTRIDMMIC